MPLHAAHKELLRPLLATPERCAILMDIDGTLAPIVDRPEDAGVPIETAGALAELADRFALVACVTGRRALEARRMVGVPSLIFAGNQGIELLLPGEDRPRIDPALPSDDRVGAFLGNLDTQELKRHGVRREDKGPIQVLHWRGATDESQAEALVTNIGLSASDAGLVPHRGRKVLELRPVGAIDKGSAVRRLIGAYEPLDAAIFAGDDRTDLDAFRALSELAETPSLGAAVRVGVLTAESPAEIEAEADFIVPGTDGVLEILQALRG